MDTKLQFRVKYKGTLPNGKEIEGIEEEASWYLVDQVGRFYSYGPMSPVTPCNMDFYDELAPLIKVNDEYLTIEEISVRMSNMEKARKIATSLWNDNEYFWKEKERAVLGLDEVEDLMLLAETLR